MIARKKRFRYERMIAFLAANGKCAICGEPIREKVWIWEHMLPLWKGGPDTYDNMKPVHVLCANPKPRREAAERAKIKRIGKTRPQSRAIPGSKRSGFRIRLTRAGPKTER